MERWAELTTDGARRVVTFEREFRTDAVDLWHAITDPKRAGRWLGSLSHDGEAVTIGFAGGSTRSGRVLECEAPHRLRVVLDPDTAKQSVLVATLEPTNAGTKLVMQQDGLPPLLAALFTAGWQHHIEQLDVVAGGDAAPTPFPELIAGYREAEARAVAGWITRTDDGAQFELERVIEATPETAWAALTMPGRFDSLPQPFELVTDDAARELTISWPDSDNEVTIALSGHSAGTMLRLRQSPTPDVEAGGRLRSGPDFAAGWHSIVDALVAYLSDIALPEGDALWQAAYAVYSEERSDPASAAPATPAARTSPAP